MKEKRKVGARTERTEWVRKSKLQKEIGREMGLLKRKREKRKRKVLSEKGKIFNMKKEIERGREELGEEREY